MESLGEFRRLPVFSELARLAMSGEPLHVRVKAVETHMDNAGAERSVAFASALLASDAPIELKREVMDGLEDLGDGAGIPLLLEIVRTTNNAELRRRALETLIESDDPRAIAALRNVR